MNRFKNHLKKYGKLRRIYISAFSLFLLINSVQAQFVTTWQVSSEESITIPTLSYLNYTYRVDWGDKSEDPNVYTGNASHTYAEAGTYEISIKGEFPAIYFNNNGDKNNIININSWGEGKWQTMNKAFYGCSNLNSDAKDVPDLSLVLVTNAMFENCTSFNGDVSDWDMGNVIQANQMFKGATSFNKDVSDWNVTGLISAIEMFENATLFNQGLGNWTLNSIYNLSGMLDNSGMSSESFDQTLNGWANNTNLPTNITLGAEGLNYCNEDSRKQLIGNKNWTITGDKPCYNLNFVTTWKTTSFNEAITLPIIPSFGDGPYVVNWGDGHTETLTSTYATHTYSSPGFYTVEVWGNVVRVYFPGTSVSNRQKIMRIERWGNTEWVNMSRAFFGCANLNINASDAPNLSRAFEMQLMFFGATSLNADISNWDVSQVRNMSSMFKGASSFNQDIGSWNVSNVQNMHGMFEGASSFNQDISGWDVSSVTSMGSMFRDASSFNQDLSNWQVSKVHHMGGMFYSASSFDQNLGNWDVSSIGSKANFSMITMFDNSGLSSSNYDSTLIGWASLPTLKYNVTLGAFGLNYCPSISGNARAILEENYNWTIYDDSPLAFCNPSVFLRNQFQRKAVINDLSENVSIAIYPNPASEVMKVSFAGGEQSYENVSILTLSGKELLRFEDVNTAATLNIPLAHFPPGLFLVVINTGNEKVVHKFSKK